MGKSIDFPTAQRGDFGDIGQSKNRLAKALKTIYL